MKNSTDLVESFLKLYGLENSKTTANPGRRSTVMELVSATPLDGHDYSNFRTAVRKIHLHGTLETRHAPCHPKSIHTRPQSPTTESKCAVKQLIRYLKGTQHACLRLQPCGMVQKGWLELVGRSDSDWAGESARRRSCYGIS